MTTNPFVEALEMTPEERAKIAGNFFTHDEPPRLRSFSPKQPKKLVVLEVLARRFEEGRDYTEPEVNAILKAAFDDFATLRRAMVDYKFLERTPDCRVYRLRG